MRPMKPNAEAAKLGMMGLETWPIAARDCAPKQEVCQGKWSIFEQKNCPNVEHKVVADRQAVASFGVTSPLQSLTRLQAFRQVVRHPYDAAGCGGQHKIRVCYARGFFCGTPLVWQSAHLTVWMLWGLFVFLNVVSIVSTLMPQFESCGWHVVQEARAAWACFSWQAKQLRPS